MKINDQIIKIRQDEVYKRGFEIKYNPFYDEWDVCFKDRLIACMKGIAHYDIVQLLLPQD